MTILWLSNLMMMKPWSCAIRGTWPLGSRNDCRRMRRRHMFSLTKFRCVSRTSEVMGQTFRVISTVLSPCAATKPASRRARRLAGIGPSTGGYCFADWRVLVLRLAGFGRSSPTSGFSFVSFMVLFPFQLRGITCRS